MKSINEEVERTSALRHGANEEVVLLTRKEVAKLLNISLVTLHHHNKKGILKPTYKIGRRILYSRNAVLQSIALSNPQIYSV